MGYLTGLNEDSILEMAREDYRSALEARRDVETRKLRDYRLYRRFNSMLTGGGLEEDDKGEHGWAKLTVPLVFWITETVLPRLGVDPPKVTVTPRTPEAGPFAQAAQLRMDRHMKRLWFQDRAIRAIKQFLILGDSPIKTPWDQTLGGPGMLVVPWFDWFISPEALVWDEAEVLFHRTWHTRRSLQDLAARDARLDEPAYDHSCLEELADMATRRDAQDESWAPRREASGFQSEPMYDQQSQVCMVECWYRDGSRVVIGGMGEHPDKLVRVVEEPAFTDPQGVPFRPFTVLQNSPDLFTPYGISDAEMLEDHQREVSTLRRQWVDQMTANLNAPIAYDDSRIRAEDVQAGFGQPNGLIPTNGDPNGMFQRIAPGFSSQDFPALYEMVRSEAQAISGSSDISMGQNMYGANNETATGMSIIASESNMRYRMKLKLVSIGVQRLACHWHWLDRALGSPILGVQVPTGFQPGQDQLGVAMDRPGFASVSNAGYMEGAEYDIDVDAGAMAPPGQGEQVQKARSLLMDIMNVASANPQVAGMVDWPGLLKMQVEAAGYDPERILVQQPPAQGVGVPGVPGVALPGAVPPGPPAGPPPVDAPVGAPA